MITNLVVLTAVHLCFLVESSGGRNTVAGDGGNAVGAYQIWPITVHEANRIVKQTLWVLDDRNCPQKSRAICATILQYHFDRGTRTPVQLAARWRNPNGNAPAWHVKKLEQAFTN